jgi:ketosteroid isomerase-like protein
MKKLSYLFQSMFAILILCSLFSFECEAQSVNKVNQLIAQKGENFVLWFNEGNIEAILMEYREDACALSFGCGRENIKKYYRDAMAAGYKMKSLTPVDITVSDTIAVEKGLWVIVFSTGAEMKGSYLTEWHKTNGEWKIVNDIANTAEVNP